MTKTKYYITNENGEEILIRTSKNEYHYYYWGRCSKTYEGCVSEKTSRINETKRSIDYFKKVLNNQKLIEKEAQRYHYTTEEIIKNYSEWLAHDEEKLIEYQNEPIRELYTKA